MEISEDRWHGLARSSPWRWRTVRFALTRRRGGETSTVDAWVRRPDGVRVVESDGRVVAEVQPGDRCASWVPVTLDRDGFVRVRPPETSMAQDPFWSDYRWVAMLDPHELADGEDPSGSGRRVAGASLAALQVDDRHGRETWWAQVRPLATYNPRCTCCPLLPGEVSEQWLQQGGCGDIIHENGFDHTTSFLVGLDVQTGIVVSLTHLDGSDVGDGFEVRIDAVDKAMTDELFR